MATNFIKVTRGNPSYGMAIRNTPTYPEGEWRVRFYQTKKGRDRAVERHRGFMNTVIPVEVDLSNPIEGGEVK